jgi:hypothetical protein
MNEPDPSSYGNVPENSPRSFWLFAGSVAAWLPRDGLNAVPLQGGASEVSVTLIERSGEIIVCPEWRPDEESGWIAIAVIRPETECPSTLGGIQ